ncbi:hypothetical protein J437_LFUL014414 [Ladona fulva]|uniref:Transposase Tc1-like domain-containing protein n=1 Tax=Ladona fulva TaxID=123851 RepID=A0A8K0K622_LADFU|nr:hypothetical protein J437_LFUL014414 [Ladona fulva]
MSQLTPRRRNQVAGMLAANVGVCEIGRVFDVSHSTIVKRSGRNSNASTGNSQTVRRRLRFSGLEARRAAVKEILTDAHKQARLAFAQKHIDKSVDFWKTVIFSDEKTFSSCPKGPVTVYRPRNSRFDPIAIASGPLINTGYEINCRMVFVMWLPGIGREGMNLFCGLMDIGQGLSKDSYDLIVGRIHHATSAVFDMLCEKAVKEEMGENKKRGSLQNSIW